MPSLQYSCFPDSETQRERAEKLETVFRPHREEIESIKEEKGEGSDEVLSVIRPGLEELGFNVEKSKKRIDKIPLSVELEGVERS